LILEEANHESRLVARRADLIVIGYAPSPPAAVLTRPASILTRR